MGVSYSASAVLGIQLTEDIVFEDSIGHYSKCGHEIPSGKPFCGSCGARVELVKTHPVKPPFNKFGDRWNGDLGSFMAENCYLDMGGFQVFNADGTLAKTEGGPYILGKAIWESGDLANSDSFENVDPVELIKQRNALMEQLKQLEITERPVRLFFFGGC
jgi:hypothetical protein